MVKDSNSMRGNHFLYLLITLFLLHSCKRNDSVEIPAGVYPPDSMAQIMADIHITEAILQQKGYQPELLDYKSAMIQKTLRDNGADPDRFNLSYEYYLSVPETFSTIYDQVISEISRREAAAANKTGRDSL